MAVKLASAPTTSGSVHAIDDLWAEFARVSDGTGFSLDHRGMK